jgi:hypothetical protein
VVRARSFGPSRVRERRIARLLADPIASPDGFEQAADALRHRLSWSVAAAPPARVVRSAIARLLLTGPRF